MLCMNSMVPSLFITTNVTAIKSVVNSISRLTNGELFEGINMFLVLIYDNKHYYLCVMNLAKNEGNKIDGFNMDTYWQERVHATCFGSCHLMPEIG